MTQSFALMQGDPVASVVALTLPEGAWNVQYTVRGSGNTATATGRFQVDNGINASEWKIGPQNGAPDVIGSGSAILVVGAGGLTVNINGQCTGVASDEFRGTATIVALKVA